MLSNASLVTLCVSAGNPRLHLSESVASPTALTSIWSITSSGGHVTAGLSDDVQECGWSQEATSWNLEWSGAEHYWHCYQRMEKPSACLCSREGPTYRTLTAAVEQQRDIWINSQSEWPKCWVRWEIEEPFDGHCFRNTWNNWPSKIVKIH